MVYKNFSIVTPGLGKKEEEENLGMVRYFRV